MEYLPRRQAGRQSLSPIPCQEVLKIMEAVRESAILGAANSDIAETRKIFEGIASSAKDFIAKISGKKDNAVVGGNNVGGLKKKMDEIKVMINAIEKKEKEITESIGRLELETEEK